MVDDISDGAEDVVGVLTARIEAHFDMGMDHLEAAVASAPDANPDATDVVKWHGLLVESQTVLDGAEDALLAALETQPSQVDDPTMGLAHHVNAAVAARDGRAMVVRWLLDPDAPGKGGLAAEQLTRLNRGPGRGPAVQTRPAPRPGTAPAPQAGRGTLR
ncbi:hypothetical protein [Streptomyces meridianus]|uniref:Uncharacterized protein n=1 Tax=Streptomyces meridianus TaxID=2938945 RepID=A0ABT0XB14_9ACTN|nr:hypothetical protein [Streptomyces meridianus]MCM2579702.1 hypothetical protein [Streptomyces meridianus]